MANYTKENVSGREKKKKHSWGLMLYLPFWALIIVMFTGLLIMQLSRYNEYRLELTQVEAEIAAAQKTYDDLQNQMIYYDSDAYIEQMAREQLGYVRPDEIVFVNGAAN